MAERRRYTKAQKVSAVTAALASSVSAAAEGTGVPESTLRYWVDAPEFAELRAKTREDLAEGAMLLANLAQAELMRKVRSGEVEAKDLAVIFGIAVDKGSLLAGHATARSEHRTLTDGLTDHEKQQLRDGLDRLLGNTAEAGPGDVAVGVGAAVRE
jgi:transposase-like protein